MVSLCAESRRENSLATEELIHRPGDRYKVTLKTFHCDSEHHAFEACGGIHVYQSLNDWLRVFSLYMLLKRYTASINSSVGRESCVASLDAYAEVGL